MLQSYIRRIATSDKTAPVQAGGDATFTHVARCLLTDYTRERIDEASNLFSGIGLNEIVARAVDMFVDRSLMAKRRVLKQTNKTKRAKPLASATAMTPMTAATAATAAQVSVADGPRAQAPAGVTHAPVAEQQPAPRAAPVRVSSSPDNSTHGAPITAPPLGNGHANAPEAIEHLSGDALVPVGPRTHTRYVTAEVCRTVYVRDKRRWQFELAGGGKCLSPKNPQLHHKLNHAWGGEATEENLTVFCRAHNLYQAELDFGPWAKAA